MKINECPKCQVLLYRRVFGGIEVDGCPSCGGSWFDAGELKAVVSCIEHLRKIDREFKPGIQPTTGKALTTCPKCNVPLKEMKHPSLPELLVDACRECRGIFLDHGETTRIADKLSPESQEEVSQSSDSSSRSSVSPPVAPVFDSDSLNNAGIKDMSNSAMAQSSAHPEGGIELLLRALIIPSVLLLVYLAMHSDGMRFAGSVFMAMWVHELGHAVTAWLFGHFAFPGPWITWTGESRNIVVIFLLAASIIYFGLLGIQKRNWLIVGISLSLLVTQIIATGLASRQTASAIITFFGDGGQLVIGTLLMLTFYAKPGSKTYDGWLRWGFVVIGAVAFADALHTWLPARTDFGEIPFGVQSHAGLSDASRLVENFGWDERSLIMRHIRLAQACGLLLIAAYVWGLRDYLAPRVLGRRS